MHMKLVKTIAAATLAVGLAGVASAQVNNSGAPYDIYVTGSTAYRSQVVNEELLVAAAGLTVANGFAPGTAPATADNGTSGVGKDSISAIHGVDANNNEIIIHNHFSGSVAGTVDLCQANATVTWIPDSSVPAIGAANTTGVAASNTGNAPYLAMADCAFTDSATVLLSSGVNSTGRTAGNAINAAAPTDAGVTAGPHG